MNLNISSVIHLSNYVTHMQNKKAITLNDFEWIVWWRFFIEIWVAGQISMLTYEFIFNHANSSSQLTNIQTSEYTIQSNEY